MILCGPIVDLKIHTIEMMLSVSFRTEINLLECHMWITILTYMVTTLLCIGRYPLRVGQQRLV